MLLSLVQVSTSLFNFNNLHFPRVSSVVFRFPNSLPEVKVFCVVKYMINYVCKYCMDVAKSACPLGVSE